MSTVRLKQDHKGLGKAGDTLSVPFARGKELIAAGVAEYPKAAAGAAAGGNAPNQPTSTPTPAVNVNAAGLVAELAAAKKRIAELEKVNAEQAKTAAEQAKRISLLEKENKELNELVADDAGEKTPAPPATAGDGGKKSEATTPAKK